MKQDKPGEGIMFRRFAGLAALVAFTQSLVGCAAVAALLGLAAVGAGTYIYVDGKLQRDYEVPLDRTYEASLGAVQDMRLELTEKSKDISQAQIRAKDNETPIWIGLESLEANRTKVSVRVGYTGDEQASRRIHEAIARRLGVNGA
ncbi:DUF3568 domain-containing protein [Desulfocurvibacter africanus]|uniref:DUF3568 family protein n=1 Tax=Desulfocurvibacter africanus subsp. africanus str. Walvis Bay TaxID=690850 RepID=F3YU50_DESAF|nr:DUF3568 domain-containing protein [Desulfocurvibacter africanus]EGJ48656.1 hypothetical protein Desaf_0299 [Desulfocurvibacter africanus subsp. africanus str. Walvis Bay]